MITKCKTKASYAAKPLKNIELDLEKLTTMFETTFQSTKVIAIVADGEACLIHKHGEILFKTCTDEEKMKKIAQHIYDESLL